MCLCVFFVMYICVFKCILYMLLLERRNSICHSANLSLVLVKFAVAIYVYIFFVCVFCKHNLCI